MDIKDQAREKRAAADAAKTKLADADKASKDAGGTDADLTKAAQDAQAEFDRLDEDAKTAEAAAAPSHGSGSDRKQFSKREKAEKRAEIVLAEVNRERIAEGLKPLSLAEYKEADADDVDADDEDSQPVTRGDLKSLGIVKTPEQMAGEITDADTRAAVLDELRFISKDIPAKTRYDKALAIVSSGKSSKIAQEATRMLGRKPQRFAGGGAPPREDDDAEFTPTPQEASMMKIGKLTKADVLESRRQAQEMFGGGR